MNNKGALLILCILLLFLIAIPSAFASSDFNSSTTDDDPGSNYNNAVVEYSGNLESNYNNTIVQDTINAGSDFSSLNEAISSASNGTVINLTGNITESDGEASTFSSGITINGKNITIEGNGFTISASNKNMIFTVNSGSVLTLNNVIMANGYSSGYCAGISNVGTLIVNNSTFINNTAYGSAAIDSTGVILINNSNFINNTSSGKDCGAISNVDNNAYATITNTNFIGNSASRNGGAIKNQNNNRLYIENCTFIGNHASGNSKGSYGGAIYSWDNANIVIVNSLFMNNYAGSNVVSGAKGGAIYISAGNAGGVSTANITRSKFINNQVNGTSSSLQGNGFFLERSNSTINYNIIINNNTNNIVYASSEKGNIDYNYWGDKDNFTAISNEIVKDWAKLTLSPNKNIVLVNE